MTSQKKISQKMSLRCIRQRVHSATRQNYPKAVLCSAAVHVHAEQPPHILGGVGSATALLSHRHLLLPGLQAHGTPAIGPVVYSSHSGLPSALALASASDAAAVGGVEGLYDSSSESVMFGSSRSTFRRRQLVGQACEKRGRVRVGPKGAAGRS